MRKIIPISAKAAWDATLPMFKRYRSMIVLISVFLIAISALMLSSAYLSRELNQRSQEYSVAEKMRTSYLEVMRTLLTLKLNYGEDPNSPHIAYTISSLKQSREQFQTHLNLALHGGNLSLDNGDVVIVEPFQGDGHPKRLNEINKNWQPLAKQIDEYLLIATKPSSNSVTLDIAALNAQAVQQAIDSPIKESINALQAHISRLTNILAWLQSLGIFGSIIFFTAFVFFSIRRLFVADMAAEGARKETAEIMDTVDTGLFLLDKELVIGSQYSKHLEDLLGQKNLGNKNLLDVLAGMIPDEDLNTTHAFIGQLYNPRTKERLIGSLNPLTKQQVTLSIGRKKITRYLDFSFNRVYHNKTIERVLVNVSDVTHAVTLEQRMEQEREQNDLQLEMLSRILQSDRQLINDFVRHSKIHSENINATLKSPGERPMDLLNKVQSIFREVHSLKGEASSLQLYGFMVMAENFETELNKLSKIKQLSGENFLALTVHLEELMRLTQTIDDLVSRLSNNQTPIAHNANVQAASHQSAASQFYNQFVQELAQRNGKVVDFSYIGIEESKQPNVNVMVREIALQLLRNAVVHGIESPEQRRARHKLTAGHIRMVWTEQDDHYHLTFEDDGNGIDYDAIRAKAVRLGLYNVQAAAQLNTKALLGLIFSSGFSTLDKSTEDAGRGVGLDIIKNRIVSLTGKINVATHSGAYTRFSFTFPKKPMSIR